MNISEKSWAAYRVNYPIPYVLFIVIGMGKAKPMTSYYADLLQYFSLLKVLSEFIRQGNNCQFIIVTPCGLCHSSKFLLFRLVRNLTGRIPDLPTGRQAHFVCGNDTKK